MKKKAQLGMDPGTARNHLVTDLLFGFVMATGNHHCHRCGEPLTRETFSIDHIEPWLDTPNPKELFFDQRNIAYSHLSCNIRDARRPHRISPEVEAALPRSHQLRLQKGRRKAARRRLKAAEK